jgi:hypothetical protein
MSWKPVIPRCGNQSPYCVRGGLEMRCVKESEQDWVFQCPACEQVNIITKPEYRRSLRQQVQRTNGMRLFR